MISASFLGSFSSLPLNQNSQYQQIFKRTAFPSITGFEARAPILPNPKTAEPLLTTATKLAREVYLLTSSGLLSMAIEASATPGE